MTNTRRNFLKQTASKTAELAVKEAQQRANARAASWIRPPYALDELEFSLTCTRCDACIAACPEHVIFKLPAHTGLAAAASPAMDLLHKACLLCEDWPCVQACEVDALVFPAADEDGEIPLPILSHCQVDTEKCLPYTGPECGACASSCPIEGALSWHQERPTIIEELCVGCGACLVACILEPKAIKVRSRLAS
jgi:ferredoxin-type protein NapG